VLLIKLLVVYLPLEVFILKWIPVSDIGYSLLRQIPDLLVFGLMSSLLLARLVEARFSPMIGGKVDLYLFLFIFWAFVTLLLNPGADTFLGFANIKALLRYVLLVYIILLLNPNKNQIDALVRWFWAAIIIQLFFGFFQLIGGFPVRDFLAARSTTEGIGGITKNFTGDRFEDRNDLMGTMGDTISYAYFLLIGFVFWIVKNSINGRKVWLLSLIFVILIYLSGSKAVFLTSVMVLMGYLFWQYSFKRILIWCALIFPSVLIIAGIFISTDNIAEVQTSSSHLLEGMMNSRLGVITYILPKLLFSPHNIIGFSPDKYFFTEFVTVNFPAVPFILIAVLPHVLEDVYWVAMYVYYGMIGFALWLFFLVAFYKRISGSLGLLSFYDNYLTKVAIVLLLTTLPLNLLNQAFEVRTFSFYLWLFCGLALVQRRQIIKRRIRI